MLAIDLAMVVMTVVFVAAAGGLWAFILRVRRSSYAISLGEAIIAGLLVLIVVVPGVSTIGYNIAQEQAATGYLEYLNGSLKEPQSKVTICSRDGSCRHCYDCDPYQVQETYYESKTETYTDTCTRTDSKGKTSTYSCTKTRTVQVPKTRWVTRYHSCPYATQETAYWLPDSFGRTVWSESGYLDANPVPWRQGKAIPDNFPRGAPPIWANANRNYDAGDPDPVVKEHAYTNYFLASQETQLKAYSDKIDFFRGKNLLVDHTVGVRQDFTVDGYKAAKFVVAGGLTVSNSDAWQAALGRLNSRLGNEREGDLHVVAVSTQDVSQALSFDFANAHLAYWQGRDYGNVGLSKNGIALFVGIDLGTNTVAWSIAKTGIPEGNGAMLSALANLKGTTFEPKALLGSPHANTSGEGRPKFDPTAPMGAVEQIVIKDYPFKRPCMDCADQGDTGSGYVYLKSSAYISTGAKVGIGFAIFAVSMLLIGLMVAFNVTAVLTGLVRRATSYIPRRRSADRFTSSTNDRVYDAQPHGRKKK